MITISMLYIDNTNISIIEGRLFRKINWSYNVSFNTIDAVSAWSWNLISLSGAVFSYLNLFVNRLLLPFSSVSSIIGFMLLLSIVMQILSGFYLGWYFIPEPGLVIELREEMFNETRFGFEIFQMHVRGVDTIFVLSYLHILKKIWLKNYITPESDGWILGGYAFFWFHYVVALGICLSASHLSDLTLTIAANIVWSLMDNAFKTYYLVFTNKHLNTDQLLRLMLFHYFTPWYYLYLIQLHVLFCHESWDADSGENTIEDKSGSYISWFYDAFLKEIQDAWFWTAIVYVSFWFHIVEPLIINYFYFERWNISEYDEIRFYGVAPHWYFRPLMGLLVVSPTHYEGLFWLGLFFILLTFLPVIYGFYNSNESSSVILPTKITKFQSFFFILFLWSLFYIASILPCGRYYYEVEAGYVGNVWIKFSFQYIYLYLGWIIHNLDFVEYLVIYYLESFVLICSSFFKFSFIKFKKLYTSSYKSKILWKEIKNKSWFVNNHQFKDSLSTASFRKKSSLNKVFTNIESKGDLVTFEYFEMIRSYCEIRYFFNEKGKFKRNRNEWSKISK